MQEAEHEQPNAAPARSKAWIGWGVLALIVAVLIASYVLGLKEVSWNYVRTNLDEIRSTAQANLLVSLLVFFLAYVITTAFSLPIAPVLSLLAGALFDRLLGTGVVLLAATIGATFAFLSSRYFLRAWVQRKMGERLNTFNKGVARDGAYYLLTLRLVPLFPFFLINLGMGLTPMRLWTYFWVSFAGMLPGTFLYVNAGTEIGSLQKPDDIMSLPLLGSFALLGVTPLVIRWSLAWFRRGSND